MDKKTVLAERFKTGDVEVEGVGTFTVRGMSRWEVAMANKALEKGGDLEYERFVLARCILDPVMTEGEIGEWQKVAGPLELVTVGNKVNELSGIGKGADKSDLPEDGDESGS
ncbi:hypothetical protein [Asanoa siamensis]|uniref:Uncharacterized protein n=1 Tax=Asanoa siamensis TaxID=926357 RepID=A0ABQ4CKV4_9ACTN|nr:hypothetical protein [Asanoa siamensis]GIF71909.1 hypothetical protein Asi02nite_14270 [Asanoa siamensis]